MTERLLVIIDYIVIFDYIMLHVRCQVLAERVLVVVQDDPFSSVSWAMILYEDVSVGVG